MTKVHQDVKDFIEKTASGGKAMRKIEKHTKKTSLREGGGAGVQFKSDGQTIVVEVGQTSYQEDVELSMDSYMDSVSYSGSVVFNVDGPFESAGYVAGSLESLLERKLRGNISIYTRGKSEYFELDSSEIKRLVSAFEEDVVSGNVECVVEGQVDGMYGAGWVRAGISVGDHIDFEVDDVQINFFNTESSEFYEVLEDIVFDDLIEETQESPNSVGFMIKTFIEQDLLLNLEDFIIEDFHVTMIVNDSIKSLYDSLDNRDDDDDFYESKKSETITIPENVTIDLGDREVILEKGDRVKVIEGISSSSLEGMSVLYGSPGYEEELVIDSLEKTKEVLRFPYGWEVIFTDGSFAVISDNDLQKFLKFGEVSGIQIGNSSMYGAHYSLLSK